MIHIPKVTDNQNYCGPTAISAITGYSTGCAAAWINHFRRDRPDKIVRGTYPLEVRQTLRWLGFVSVPLGTKRMTFAQWLRIRNKKHVYLVDVCDHWVVVFGNRVICSVQPQGVLASKSRFRRGIVWSVIRVVKSERKRRKEPMPPSR